MSALFCSYDAKLRISCSQLIFFINLFSSPYMMVNLKVLTLQAEKINLNKTDYGSKEKSSGSLWSSHFR